jgi:hypothetical protein
MGFAYSKSLEPSPEDEPIDLTKPASGSKKAAVALLRFIEARSFRSDADMNAVITATGQLVKSLPATNSNRGLYQYLLGNALLRRFQRGYEDKPDTAIETLRYTSHMPFSEALRVLCIRDLCRGLYMRYERQYLLEDVNEEIEPLEDLINRTSSHKPDLMSALSDALQRRFARTRMKQDIDQAVAMAKAAVDATIEGDLDALLRFSILVSALLLLEMEDTRRVTPAKFVIQYLKFRISNQGFLIIVYSLLEV